jgi:hypothetical protein
MDIFRHTSLTFCVPKSYYGALNFGIIAIPVNILQHTDNTRNVSVILSEEEFVR